MKEILLGAFCLMGNLNLVQSPSPFKSRGTLLGSNKDTNKLYSIKRANGILTKIDCTGIATTILGMYNFQVVED